jgi:hypothetical protein
MLITAMLAVVSPASIEFCYQGNEVTFTEARPQDSLSVLWSLFLYSYQRNYGFVLALFFYRAYFPISRYHLYRDWSRRQFFVGFVPVISFPKQTLVLTPFFYRA